jgi:hypothetical protein
MKQLIVIVLFLFSAVLLYLITLPPKQITLKDLEPEVFPRTIPEEPEQQETNPVDSIEEVFNPSIPNESSTKESVSGVSSNTDISTDPKVEYYIIVGSFNNLKQAQQEADKLNKDYSANIIILPPTAKGIYRISVGKYNTIEAAKSSIQSIKTKIKSDSWIFSLTK